jgi:hypothetical protein
MKTKKELLSTILYEKSEIPVFLQFRKNVLKFIIVFFPLTTFVLLFTLIALLANFQYLRSHFKQSAPQIVSELKQKNLDLNAQILAITNSQKELETRLSTSDTVETDQFSIFKKPVGQKDFTQTPIFAIDSLLIEPSANAITISFNLKNLNEEVKQSGHIFVVMQEKSSLQIYPSEGLPSAGEKIPFSAGEAYATARFRPVKATFSLLDATNTPVFTVVVYNRQGDIIMKERLTK